MPFNFLIFHNGDIARETDCVLFFQITSNNTALQNEPIDLNGLRVQLQMCNILKGSGWKKSQFATFCKKYFEIALVYNELQVSCICSCIEIGFQTEWERNSRLFSFSYTRYTNIRSLLFRPLSGISEYFSNGKTIFQQQQQQRVFENQLSIFYYFFMLLKMK